jgi:hypothetical protein
MRERILRVLVGGSTLAAMAVTGMLLLAPAKAEAATWIFWPGFQNQVHGYCVCGVYHGSCLCGRVIAP